MDKKKQVVILGGGLAGLAAAVPLAEEGFEIILVERKPFLGGRAASYPIPPAYPATGVTSGQTANSPPLKKDKEFSPSATARWQASEPGSREWVDNCQHVLLPCCTNLLDFYGRLGVQQGIAFHDRYLFLDEQGALSILHGSWLPAPFHLLPSFFRFGPLGWRDKLAIAYAFFSMLREEHKLEELDRITMLQWLRQHRQSDRAIQLFWRTVLVSALNEEVEVASARYGLKVFLDGMLKHRHAFHLGVPSVPLSELYTEPSLRFLRKHGGAVRLRNSAVQIEIKGPRVCGVVLSDGTRLTGDYYLSSLPPEALLKLLPEEVVEKSRDFAKLRLFQSSPITAIYLWFDREVTKLKYAAVLGHEIQWIFNQAENLQMAGKKQGACLGLVVSASKRLLPLSRDEIVDIALRDLKEVLPLSREASLLRSVVIKEPFATFSCRAGCDELRLDQESSLDNFLIAGDWTGTGWPPTMEGAVRSGYRCAELIMKKEGAKASFLQPNLPPESLVRWISSFF